MVNKVAIAGLFLVFMGLVAAILFPVFAKVHSGGGPNRVSVHLEHLALALQQYAQDNNDLLPPMQDALTARRALASYAVSNEWGTQTPADNFVNPFTNEAFEPNPVLSGKPLKSFKRLTRQQTIAFYDARPYNDGGHTVLMLNGSVKFISATQWVTIKRISKLP